MNALLIWIARAAGIVGVAAIAVAAVARLGGAHWLGGLQVGTLLQGGMAATLVACLCYLAAMAERARA